MLYAGSLHEPAIDLFIMGYIIASVFGVYLALDCGRWILVAWVGLQGLDPALRLARDLLFSVIILVALMARSAFVILALDVRDSADLALAVSPSGAWELAQGTLTPDITAVIAGSLAIFLGLVLGLRLVVSCLVSSRGLRRRVLASGVGAGFIFLSAVWQMGLVSVQAQASQQFAQSYLFQPGFHLLKRSIQAAGGASTEARVMVKAFEPFPDLGLGTPGERSRQPSIVLVISETVRGDLVDARVMPRLAAYTDRTVRFEKVYASANGTHLSWFALHSGQSPIYWWHQRRETVQPGSPVFQHLRGSAIGSGSTPSPIRSATSTRGGCISVTGTDFSITSSPPRVTPLRPTDTERRRSSAISRTRRSRPGQCFSSTSIRRTTLISSRTTSRAFTRTMRPASTI